MSSTQDALNSEPLAPAQENQVSGGANEQREESKENANNQQETETKANSVPKKTKKTKKETKATAENGETAGKTNVAQDETANVQNAQPSEGQGESEGKTIKKKSKKNSSKKEEENANQTQENAENKDAKTESAAPEQNKEGESAENKPKKKKKAVTKPAPTANEVESVKQETTEEAKKVEKTVPVSKPVEKAAAKPAVQADSKPKESITLAKAEPQKPANLKEIAKQDAKDKNTVVKAEPAKANTAKPTTAAATEKTQVQPTETKANLKATVAQKPNNVAPAQTTTEQAKPAKGGKTVVVKSQPEILPEKGKPVANEQVKKLESTEGSQANLNKKAKSPDSYKQAVKNLRGEKPTPGTASGQKPKTAIEKQRIRSFDAGKTDKISADDSFETRSKLWEIRKKEKLLGQEKKKRKKEAAECTFAPQLNKNSRAKELPPGDIYERCSEWSSKVKESLAEKGEKIMEEARKPEMKKSRVKSAVGSKVFDPRVLRTTHDDLAAQYGTRRANLQYPQQHVLEIKDNVVDKVSEIREMYDVITSAIKNKSKRPIPQTSDPLKKHKADLRGEVRASSATYSSQPKTAGVKPSPNGIKNDESSRLESLKGILNLKLTNKSSASGATKNGGTSEDQVYLSQSKNVDTLLKQDSKHLEIRNNRYVMVDNLPSTENRGVEGDDLSLNLESAEVL